MNASQLSKENFNKLTHPQKVFIFAMLSVKKMFVSNKSRLWINSGKMTKIHGITLRLFSALVFSCNKSFLKLFIAFRVIS